MTADDTTHPGVAELLGVMMTCQKELRRHVSSIHSTLYPPRIVTVRGPSPTRIQHKSN